METEHKEEGKHYYNHYHNHLKMSRRKLSLFKLISVVFLLASSCATKEKTKLNDEGFSACEQSTDRTQIQSSLFTNLRAAFQKRGIDLNHPDSKKFYMILKSRIEGHDRGTLQDNDIDLKQMCNCDNPVDYETGDVVDSMIQCIVNDLAPEKAEQVRRIAAPGEPGEKDLKDFIDNYEDGPGKTYVLTLLLLRTTI